MQLQITPEGILLDSDDKKCLHITKNSIVSIEIFEVAYPWELEIRTKETKYNISFNENLQQNIYKTLFRYYSDKVHY